MTLYEKYILWQMIYVRLIPLIPRGYSKSFITPLWAAKDKALRRTNYILAAIHEELTVEELIMYIYTPREKRFLL